MFPRQEWAGGIQKNREKTRVQEAGQLEDLSTEQQKVMDLPLRKGTKAPKEFGFILFVAENHWRKKEMGLKAMPYSDLKMVVLTCIEDGEKRFFLKKKMG